MKTKVGERFLNSGTLILKALLMGVINIMLHGYDVLLTHSWTYIFIY